ATLSVLRLQMGLTKSPNELFVRSAMASPCGIKYAAITFVFAASEPHDLAQQYLSDALREIRILRPSTAFRSMSLVCRPCRGSLLPFKPTQGLRPGLLHSAPTALGT